MKPANWCAAAALLFVTWTFSTAQHVPVPQEPVANETRDSQFFLEQNRAPSESPDYSNRVRDLLQKMNLREKIGQMTQLDLGMVTDGQGQDIKINPQKLDKAVIQYGVGSIFNAHDEALPPAKWHDFINQIQAAAAQTRLHIPVVYGIDSIHGANYVRGSILFPQPLAMAATWNPELVLRAAQITAMETRSAGIPWDFSPVLDIGRQPLWPRLYETYGEDPVLAKTMGVAVIRGYEGKDVSQNTSVAACLKHYIGYSGPTTGHDRTPALIPEITLREYYLPSFRAAVEAGAHTVMVNSAEINGVPGHANKYLLTDVLRAELGFKGVVVSDWEDIKKLVTVHRAAATEKDATRLAIMAGIDMSMVPSDYSFSDLLYQLVQEGAVPVSRIDEAAGRILTLKFQLGLFEAHDTPAALAERIGTPESRQVSLQAAHEAITLLKNDGNLLPLRKNMHVLLTGPTCNSLRAENNGWTYTWQGSNTALYPKRPTLRDAVEQKIGTGHLTFLPGATFDAVEDLTKVEHAAAQADAAILCLGENSYTETPGNIEDLTLPDAQLRLGKAAIAAGKPVVLVLIEGRPRIISAIAHKIPAIVMAYNPSNEGGEAIADVLFGDHNPSGRLPITYPRSPNSLLTYDRKQYQADPEKFPLQGFLPQFEFGSGLSYTHFTYSDLAVSPASVEAEGKIGVSVKVTNSGSRAGKEVVQVYLSQKFASITPPGRRLVRFAKIQLAPGATESLNFTLERADFEFIGANLKPTVEAGEFEVMVGEQRASFWIKDQ
ncbi:MAG TPA: glycoside hydrolase family 3 N-terminal domain-containing protein [Candidatus Sulfotelmatobacter sp.]|nr:glycoside hydrolase family 3 N-terminal domain-containing protein [Candidatus Sulfotelmatobacter sp.]